MTNKRIGMFETNSSSVHSIVIAESGVDYLDQLPKEIKFCGEDFGWEWEHYSDYQSRANYLYTGIVYCNLVQEMVPKIVSILNKWGIKSEFQPTEVKISEYSSEPYDSWVDGYYGIDHGGELEQFITKVCNDEILLMTYLFSPDSFIDTGNDNEEGEFTDINAIKARVLLSYEKGN